MLDPIRQSGRGQGADIQQVLVLPDVGHPVAGHGECWPSWENEQGYFAEGYLRILRMPAYLLSTSFLKPPGAPLQAMPLCYPDDGSSSLP